MLSTLLAFAVLLTSPVYDWRILQFPLKKVSKTEWVVIFELRLTIFFEKKLQKAKVIWLRTILKVSLNRARSQVHSHLSDQCFWLEFISLLIHHWFQVLKSLWIQIEKFLETHEEVFGVLCYLLQRISQLEMRFCSQVFDQA